ncbi:MAG: Uma2 family endonuclease, partial [Planctomycetota bacterium]
MTALHITESERDVDFVVPPISSLDDFRRWCLSEDFPERGRIDYIDGRLEIDMSPQSTHRHGRVAYSIVETLAPIVRQSDLGILVGDCSRIALPTADTSREPDIVFISHESLESGRVVEVEKSGRPGDSVELVGPPDVVVEVVSDWSVTKDKKALRRAYEKAGVTEYRIIDARSDPAEFLLLRLEKKRYRARKP